MTCHLPESLVARQLERSSDAHHTNQCLPFGYAAMLWFATHLLEDDFDPEEHGMGMYRVSLPLVPADGRRRPGCFRQVCTLGSTTGYRLDFRQLARYYHYGGKIRGG
jgi:hypothetical protein